MIDRVPGIVEAVRQRMEDELRQQLTTLTTEHERALDQALREAARASEQQAQDAEARWAGLLTEARAGAQQMVESAVSTARGEAEAQYRAEASAAAGFLRQLTGELERATTLSGALTALSQAIAARGEGSLLVARRGRLERWGSPDGDVRPASTVAADEAIQRLQPVRQHEAMAAPIVLDGSAVAVLVSGPRPEHDTTLELAAAAGAARIAALTSSRLLQADRWTATGIHGSEPALAAASDFPSEASKDEDGDPEGAAVRYARLVISEIKLYNEDAVRAGRANRDLGRRLAPEIERARHIYEARVPGTTPRRAEHFQAELVRTLADGDTSLLA